MSKKNRDRKISRSVQPVAVPQARSRRNWWLILIVGAVLVLVATVITIRNSGGSKTPTYSNTTVTASATPQDQVYSPAPPLGFYSSAPLVGPYNAYSHSQLRAWLFELLDQHPNREFAMRLKGYLQSGQAEVVFESIVIEKIERGDIGNYGLARLGMGIQPAVPTLVFDTIVFDRRYMTVQNAFRTISHEGCHLDQVMIGATPVKLIGEMPESAFTQDDIRVLYEGEVEAYQQECILSHGKPDYRTINVDHDFCDDYEREGVNAIRTMVAESYTAYLPLYNRHREYIFRLAKDPSAR